MVAQAMAYQVFLACVGRIAMLESKLLPALEGIFRCTFLFGTAILDASIKVKAIMGICSLLVLTWAIPKEV